jgi:hypothetical protein
MEIGDELVAATKEWLGDDGINHFKRIKTKYGCVNACWFDDGIPHPVHFREGMEIRNFMRTSGYCDDWTSHDFDDNWVSLIDKIID